MNTRNIDINIPKNIAPFLHGAFTFVALQSTCNTKYSEGFDKFVFKKRFQSAIQEDKDFTFKADEDELRMILNLTNTLMQNPMFMNQDQKKENNLNEFSSYIDNQVKHFKMLFTTSHF